MINIGKTVAMSYHTKQSKFPLTPKIACANTDVVYKSDKNFLVFILQKIWNGLLIYAY